MTKSESFIPHNKIFATLQDAEAVHAATLSGQWACGEKVAALEHALAAYTGRKYCVCVASGTAALRLALASLGIGGKTDEVIMPAYVCVSLANAALALGANPVPVDVSPSDWCLDVKCVKAALNSTTRAIIAVDMFGSPAAIDELRELGIPVIEDCAHGFGSTRNGLVMGRRGCMAVTSLYATKFLGCGEGGAIFTDDKEQAQWLMYQRDYTDKAPAALRYNDKLSDIEAALALSRLARLEAAVQWRYNLALAYEQALRPLAARVGIVLPDPDSSRIWYRYTLVLPKPQVDDLIAFLRTRQTGADRPVEKWHDKLDARFSLPVSDMAFEHILSLPFHEGVTPEDVKRIAGSLEMYFCGKVANE